ncbi:MAG: NAD(P)-dependent oxidoreductase [Thiohalocapsa sp.]|jgi:3-hydroxyisobutyrate dehydrogenase|uniref:NAD(P)-dependent oxidoreductase n=1 Tax=Thiohalocapsa sp. TaxID=2497641 RepID=UPI0025DB5140|nr:NAD(P)-dependent oxidoreductase [Thiohalocapsa sp.]MCG6941783.1 NAD(P)-dependent oxidoreductase [Thiohalocapsa sp.]
MRISVLGTGLLGSEIALRLKAQGFGVSAWNRTAEKAAPLATAGIALPGSAADAVAVADAVLLLLADAAAIEATLFAADTEPALAGRIIVQMGTIAPAESRTLAERVAAAGGEYLESPVLGSLPEARAGKLFVMAGGDPALYERCLPVFEALSETPQRIGELGQAAALKLALNQLIAGLTATFCLSLGLVRKEALDVEQFMTVVRGSALYAPTFDKKLDKYLSHDYGSANFPLKHLLKDVRLMERAMSDAGIDTATLRAIAAAAERGVAAGFGEADYSALYEALNQGAGD